MVAETLISCRTDVQGVSECLKGAPPGLLWTKVGSSCYWKIAICPIWVPETAGRVRDHVGSGPRDAEARFGAVYAERHRGSGVTVKSLLSTDLFTCQG